MKSRFLIWIDQLAWPLAWLMEMATQFAGQVSSRPQAAQRPVIMKFFGMGSIIRLASILEERNFDKSQVLLITLDQNAETARLMGFRNVASVRMNTGLPFDLWTLVNEVRRFRPTVILDLERSSNLVSMVRLWLSRRLNIEFIGFDNRRNNRSFKQGMVYALDSIQPWRFLEDWVGGIQTARPSNGQTVKVDPDKVLINLNASDYLAQRRYPLDQYRSVIDSLRSWKPQLQFHFTGTSNEQALVANFLEGFSNPREMRNQAGKWDLHQLTQELSDCSLFITNDSGPMHLAAFLGVPTIALWGPTHYSDFGYRQVNGTTNLSAEKPCSPCFRNPKSEVGKACDRRIDCMLELKPESIVTASRMILGAVSGTREVRFPPGYEMSTVQNQVIHA